MKTSDPILRQKAIVSGLTQGRVDWTPEHREALKAMAHGQPLTNPNPSILEDLEILLGILVTQLQIFGKQSS